MLERLPLDGMRIGSDTLRVKPSIMKSAEGPSQSFASIDEEELTPQIFKPVRCRSAGQTCKTLHVLEGDSR